jgi:hypothetical protein
MWPFKKACGLGAGQEWQLTTFLWLVRNIHREAWKTTTLQMPTTDNFPSNGLQGHELALHLYGMVKERSGMASWKVKLEPAHEVSPAEESPWSIPLATRSTAPAGTFQLTADAEDGLAARITYAPKLLSAPVDYIATIAHELAHYVIAGARRQIPGGEALHEHATDMTAISMGWGLFLLRSSARYEQFSSGGMQGHSSTRQGYLSPGQCAFALGLFLEAKRLEYAAVSACLSPHHNRLLTESVATIRRTLCFMRP